VTYLYDNAGNRNSVSDSVNGTTAYTPNNLNQYVNNVGSDAITNGTQHEIASYKSVRAGQSKPADHDGSSVQRWPST